MEIQIAELRSEREAEERAECILKSEEFVKIIGCDIDGIWRCKVLSADKFKSGHWKGLGMASSTNWKDSVPSYLDGTCTIGAMKTPSLLQRLLVR
jgi:hypothetical protein